MFTKFQWRTKSARYQHSAPTLSPYEQARQVWDYRVGKLASAAKAWQALALVMLAWNVVLIGTLVWQYQHSKTIRPFLIVADTDGVPHALGLLPNQLPLEDRMISGQLMQFVRWVRSKSVDPNVVQSDWDRAWDFVEGPAHQQLVDYFQALETYLREPYTAREVEITNIIARSTNTYQVRWSETSYGNGKRLGQQAYTGELTFVLRQSTDPEQLYRNPYGLYVTAIFWQQDAPKGAR